MISSVTFSCRYTASCSGNHVIVSSSKASFLATHMFNSLFSPSQHLTSSKLRCLCASISPYSDTFRYMMCERRGMLVLTSVPPLVRIFQIDQASVGAGINPT
jgi:hypothetical protein